MPIRINEKDITSVSDAVKELAEFYYTVWKRESLTLIAIYDYAKSIKADKMIFAQYIMKYFDGYYRSMLSQNDYDKLIDQCIREDITLNLAMADMLNDLAIIYKDK